MDAHEIRMRIKELIKEARNNPELRDFDTPGAERR